MRRKQKKKNRDLRSYIHKFLDKKGYMTDAFAVLEERGRRDK